MIPEIGKPMRIGICQLNFVMMECGVGTRFDVAPDVLLDG
jgi:hypothetical protein